jgi:hypothetical protein
MDDGLMRCSMAAINFMTCRHGCHQPSLLLAWTPVLLDIKQTVPTVVGRSRMVCWAITCHPVELQAHASAMERASRRTHRKNKYVRFLCMCFCTCRSLHHISTLTAQTTRMCQMPCWPCLIPCWLMFAVPGHIRAPRPCCSLGLTLSTARWFFGVLAASVQLPSDMVLRHWMLRWLFLNVPLGGGSQVSYPRER